MSCVSLTETGLLALCGMLIGFVVSFCKTAERSRCKNITLCWGMIDCKREPFSGETILQMEESRAEDVNREIVPPNSFIEKKKNIL